MADPVVGITNGVPTSGTGTITTLGQTLVDGANATMGITTGAAVVTDASGTIQQYLRGLVKQWAAGALGVVLGAETTKIIGNVGIKDGTSTLVLSAASTGAPAATVVALPVTIRDMLAPGAAVAASSAPVVIASNQATLAVAPDTSQIANGLSGTMLTPAKVKISVASATTTTLVALVSAKKIRILSMYLVSTAANTVTFQSHTTTTNSDGGAAFAANGGYVLPFNPIGWFDTTAGEALDMVTSGAGQVSGQLTYVAV